MSSLEGQALGPYNITQKVFESGIVTVYKAFDTRLECDVAIKIICKDNLSPHDLALVLKRFEREAKSKAKISHPNIVNVINYGKYQNAPYLVLEYLSGGTLKERLGKKITFPKVVVYLMPVANALFYAHQLGVIHRDIKPSNILFTGTDIPKLSDFGITKILETHPGDSLTDSGIGIGTPEYMAPEQCLGQPVDARTDVYSLGIVLYEMLTGCKPFQADTPEAVISKQISEPFPPLRQFVPDLSESVEYILFKALAKNPANRYPDIDAFSLALVRLAIKDTAPTDRVSLPEPVAPPLDASIGEYSTEISPAVSPSIPDAKPNKLLFRINRLEKAVGKALASEDLEDAEKLLSTLEGLGEPGLQAASRLRQNLEQTRENVEQREAEISRLKAAISQALVAEDITQAGILIQSLAALGAQGKAQAVAFQKILDKAQQQVMQRRAEIDSLSDQIVQQISEEAWQTAQNTLKKLELLGEEGKEAAAHLGTALEQAQKQSAQRDKKIARTASRVRQSIARGDFLKAEKLLAGLPPLGEKAQSTLQSLQQELAQAYPDYNPPQVENELLTEASNLPVRQAVPSSDILITPSDSVQSPPETDEQIVPTPETTSATTQILKWRKYLSRRWLASGMAFLILLLIVGVNSSIRQSHLNSTATVTSRALLVWTKTPTPKASPTARPATATASQTATFTFTPTRTSSPTNTPSPTPQLFMVTVDEDIINIRGGPATVYDIITNKLRGTILEAIGRNITSNWFVVRLDNGKTGWISTKVLRYTFDASLLPIVVAPPTPVILTKSPPDSSGSASNPPTWTPPPP